jgi:hypothetical protein
LAQFARAQRDLLSSALDRLFAQLRSQAPAATVLMLGYPHIFPASAAEQTCAKLHVAGFNRDEQNYLRQATSELNQTVAARAEASGYAKFLAVDRAFAGHEICGNAGEWINGPTFSILSWKVNDQSFHPNAPGHRLGYAGVINHFVNSV